MPSIFHAISAPPSDMPTSWRFNASVVDLSVPAIQIWTVPCPFHCFMPSKTQHSSSYTSHILIVQEKIHNIKTRFCSDSVENTALPRTRGKGEGGLVLVFLRLEGSSSVISVQDPLSAMQESGWHHLVSIQIPLWSQMKGSFAIILSPLQIYCRDFKGRTFLEVKWLGRSKGRNIPKGQVSFIRYWTLTTAVTHIQTTHFWAT